MNEVHILVDCRGGDDGPTYHVWAGFSYEDAIDTYYDALVADHPNLKRYLYRQDVESRCTQDSIDLFVIGDNDGPTIAFTEIEPACDYMQSHPETALHMFVVPYDPRYAPIT